MSDGEGEGGDEEEKADDGGTVETAGESSRETFPTPTGWAELEKLGEPEGDRDEEEGGCPEEERSEDEFVASDPSTWLGTEEERGSGGLCEPTTGDDVEATGGKGKA